MGFNWHQERTDAEWSAQAANFRQMAKEAAQRAIESFDRCDTDGFLSQWASNSMSQHYRICAELCDTQGMRECPALFDLAGNLVSTRMIDGQYGRSWLTTEEHVRAGGRQFVSPSRARKGAVRHRNLKIKGYTVGTIKIRCGVFQRSGGSYQVTDVTEPLRDTRDIEIICTDNGPGENWD
jgi:sucrose-6-phosphate hydrolase SacC (GH32 family)